MAEARIVITLPGAEFSVPATIDRNGQPRVTPSVAAQIVGMLQTQYRQPTHDELVPAQGAMVLEYFNGVFWRPSYASFGALLDPDIDLTQYRVPIDWSTS